MSDRTPLQTIGRYELRRKLGAGTFGEVWLAVESSTLGFQKEVALKLLKSAGTEQQIADLLREARLAAILRHPNIVDVLSVDQSGDTFHVAMEYVDGGTLQTLRERVTLGEVEFPLSVICDLGVGIARGLEHAHTARDAHGRLLAIIHRDLKPENVLLDAAGTPKIADFGIAKVLGEGTATDVGTLKGTAAYVAPEIWKGGRDFHPRVDLFALGCILWELATLKRLFEGPIQSIFGQVSLRTADEECRPLYTTHPDLAPIIERLLLRDPEARYQTAAEVALDLTEARLGDGPAADLGTFVRLLDQTAPESDLAGLSSASLDRLRGNPDVRWSNLACRALGEPLEPSVRELRPPGVGSGLQPVEPAPPPRPPPGLRGAEPGPPRHRTPREDASGTESMILRPEPPSHRIGAVTIGLLVASGLLIVLLALLLWDPGPGTDEVAERAEPAPTAAEDLLDGLDLPELPHRDVATPRPVERPTPPREAPTPAQREEPDPRETPTPAPVETPEQVPEQTAPRVVEAPTATPQPTPAPTQACLALTSTPVGAQVWIGGAKTGLRALGSSSQGRLRAPGPVSIGMGSGDEPTASTTLTLRAGQGVRVDCELVVAKSCTTRDVGFAPCR